MRKFGRVKCRPLNIIPTDGYHAWNVQIFPCIRCNESRHWKKICVQQIERFAFVFFNDEFEPIDQRIVHALVCAETGDADSA